MSVEVSTTTVYRGGRRRWFTLKAACQAEARLLVAQHRAKQGCLCSCRDSIDHATGYTPPACEVHGVPEDQPLRRRVARLLERDVMARQTEGS